MPRPRLQLASSAQLTPLGPGYLVHQKSEKAASRHVLPLGTLRDVSRWTALHRYEPFWMKPAYGIALSEVPTETQMLLIRHGDGQHTLVIPVVDDEFRAALQGGEAGLETVVDSGAPEVVGTEFELVYFSTGPDPFRLAQECAPCVADLTGGRLRLEKPEPDGMDLFGWCTWDAFYTEVSHDKVREGLASFRAGGVEPGLVILDDGWLSITEGDGHRRRLTSFDANEEFPHGLAATVGMAKAEYGVERFYCWHALQGYWAGSAQAEYAPVVLPRDPSPEILAYNPGFAEWIPDVGVIPPGLIHDFYHDFHRDLRRQGVDGVKVDNQAALETTAAPFGGRIALTRDYREALEGSAAVHFGGNLINCMSCSNDVLYQTFASSWTRTSTDFWPDRPESHAEHLVTNALMGLWFGEFVHPDWDMFQSGHPIGAYHAAARAVSGGPVYVSDKPEGHDFDLLRKLVHSSGLVPRCTRPGLPSRDSIYLDPATAEAPFKVTNLNRFGAVVALFNPRSDVPVRGQVRPADVEDQEGQEFASYRHRTGELTILPRDGQLTVELEPHGWEIVTFAPTDSHGFAPLGLLGMLNGGGAVLDWEVHESSAGLDLLGGSHLAACRRRPEAIEVDGHEVRYLYRKGRLEFEVPGERGYALVYFPE